MGDNRVPFFLCSDECGLISGNPCTGTSMLQERSLITKEELHYLAARANSLFPLTSGYKKYFWADVLAFNWGKRTIAGAHLSGFENEVIEVIVRHIQSVQGSLKLATACLTSAVAAPLIENMITWGFIAINTVTAAHMGYVVVVKDVSTGTFWTPMAAGSCHLLFNVLLLNLMTQLRDPFGEDYYDIDLFSYLSGVINDITISVHELEEELAMQRMFEKAKQSMKIEVNTGSV